MAKRKIGGLGGLGGVTSPLMGDELLAMAALNGGPQARAHDPSLRERLGNFVYDAVGGLGGLGGIQNRMREEAQIGMDFIPGLGEAVGSEEAGRAIGNGDYLGGGLGLAASALGVVPVVGDAAAAGMKKGIRAFHGSPHDFERFDLSKIGTGEGAQAYGHGLYFAEAEDVAKSYRDALALDNGFSLEGRGGLTRDEVTAEMMRRFGTNPDGTVRYYDNVSTAQGVADGVLDDLIYGKSTRKRGPEHQALADEIREMVGSTKPGHMYEVNIRANPEDFLDWDAPLSEQSAPAQEYFRQRMDKVMPGREGWDPDGDTLAKLASPQSDLDGRDWLDTGPQEWATQQMREAGIPGIRYLDQGSRSAGGTRNYVVFDDSIIEIVRKYGLAAAIGAGVISAEMGRQMQEQGLL